MVPRSFARPFKQYRAPRYPSFNPSWGHNELLTSPLAAFSKDFSRFAMDDTDDEMARGQQQQRPDYSRKDFKRAAEDLHACLKEALNFFRKFAAEFTTETKEIKKYGDAELLDLIWEKKVLRLENGPRAAANNTDIGGGQSGQFQGNQDNESSSSSTNGSSMRSLQLRLHVTIEAMLDCKSPEFFNDEEASEFRIEEVHDFEDRMRKTAIRLYDSLGNICYEVQAFRRVIRDLTTMSQDLDLFPLNLWKSNEQESQYRNN